MAKKTISKEEMNKVNGGARYRFGKEDDDIRRAAAPLKYDEKAGAKLEYTAPGFRGLKAFFEKFFRRY